MEIFPPTDGPVPEIDPSKPHSARIYDYGLGGKNHFAADRAVAEQVLENMPQAITVARENRKFLGRAVRYLVAEAGVRQFLDIGAGLPTTENVHEVAQRVDPTARNGFGLLPFAWRSSCAFAEQCCKLSGTIRLLKIVLYVGVDGHLGGLRSQS